MAEKGFKRKLTAILSADVEGYSRLMGDDEEATVRKLTAYRDVMSTLIQQHNGKVLDSPGDNILAEFVSVVDAVQCAVAVQKEINARNTELPENRKMRFRIGINLGDVIQEEDRIYGDGVNIAARLEGLSEPGGICISKTAFDHIESKLPYGYEFLGDQTVKNIAKPVGAYRVLMEPRVTVAGRTEEGKTSIKAAKANFCRSFCGNCDSCRCGGLAILHRPPICREDGLPIAGATIDCRAAFCQYEQQSGAGIFLRWYCRSNHQLNCENTIYFGHSAQFKLCL